MPMNRFDSVIVGDSVQTEIISILFPLGIRRNNFNGLRKKKPSQS